MPTKKAAKPAKGAKSSKSSASKKPAPKPKAKDSAPAKPVKAPAPVAPPVPAPPPFVRQATAAERKAALEAVLEEQALPLPPKAAPVAPAPPPPPVVRDATAADRKAAVEQLVEESGVKGVLAKAPWKRGSPPPAPAPVPPQPPQPGQIVERAGPKLQMTKAPLESTTGRSPPRVVILDSNALMMQFQFHIDIEREAKRILNINLEIVVPEIVIKELERIAKEGNQKEATEARMAVELARTFRVEPSPGDGDTGILRLAEKLNAVVVTNDKTLRARLRAKDIPNIYMRSRAFLTLEGHIPGI